MISVNLKEELELVVGLISRLVHQTDVGDGLLESTTKNRLHQRVWSHLDGDSVGRDLLKGFVEEDRGAGVVDVVVGRAKMIRFENTYTKLTRCWPGQTPSSLRG